MPIKNTQDNIRSQANLQTAPVGTIGVGVKNNVLKSIDTNGVENALGYRIDLSLAQITATPTTL